VTVCVWCKAEERHGSAEERLREMESQLQEKDAEIQRVCIVLSTPLTQCITTELCSVVHLQLLKTH